MRSLSVLIISLSFGLLLGCAGVVAFQRAYSGPPLPSDQLAIVTVDNPYLSELVITSIDGVAAPPTLHVAELQSGRHVLQAVFQGVSLKSVGPQSVELDAQAGHVYQLTHALHTIEPSWDLIVWDVTDDIRHPQLRWLGERVFNVVNRHRPDPSTHLAIPAADPAGTPLAGFGEQRTATITGTGNQPVTLRYAFDRYSPFLRVKGSDGRSYHIEISRQTGDVVQVIGVATDR